MNYYNLSFSFHLSFQKLFLRTIDKSETELISNKMQSGNQHLLLFQVRGPRWYLIRGSGRLLILGNPKPRLPGTRPRGDRRMGRGQVVPGMRRPGLLPPRASHDHDGSDCSNRIGFLKALRIGNVFVNRTAENKLFYLQEENMFL